MLTFRKARVSAPLAVVLSLVVAVAAALTWGVAATSASPASRTAAVPVAQAPAGSIDSTIRGTTGDGRRVTGSFIPLKFSNKSGKVFVRGLVKGAVQNTDGSKRTFAVLRTLRVAKINGVPIRGGAASARSAAAAAPCDVLNLRLGPLDLDLLGLQINLNRIVLDIVAQSGAGKLLGNLLCAVAGLLDGGLGGVLNRLADLLNRIIGRLGLGL
ncbi:MAG: hypothetical protein ACXWDM_02750 [Nocardioides sp.]